MTLASFDWLQACCPEYLRSPCKSSKPILPMAWAPEDTVTIRAGALALSRSSSRSVSRNGARWLTAKVCSSPSAVTCRVAQNPPTLLTRTSRRGYASRTSRPSRRTSAWDDMSAAIESTAGLPEAAAMSAAAACARTWSRPLMPTRAPSAARPRAVALPIPPVPPVTSTVLPAIGPVMLSAIADSLSIAEGVQGWWVPAGYATATHHPCTPSAIDKESAMADNITGPMAGKTVLVTGGTGGIGKATALGLAALGARVGIIGRDHVRTQASAADIAAASGNPAVDSIAADMSSQAEVRRLGREVLDAYPRLDVLVNNVGGFWATRHVTADGLEHTFAVNHLAPFLLTDLLLDRLKASAPARIVTVSSGAQAMGKIGFDDLQGERKYSGQQAYNQSKLANVMFTYELSRRLDGSGVTATVLHPGVVRTGFAAEDHSPMWRVLLPLVRPFLKTPEKGAATSIYLASAPEVEGVTGKYFADSKTKTSSRSSYDTAAAARLWQMSVDLVGRTAGV